jgi:N-methylhydantoinase B
MTTDRGATAPQARLRDPVEMEVFSNRLLTITEEMGHTLVRASFSTNIKERQDCSVALFDGKGRLVAQASHVPLHLGSLMGSVEAVLDAYPLAEIEDGDAFICNDPYLAGGTHMPDISIVTPVFYDGKPRFFTANIAHHSDVGGSVPGSISGAARSIFEEGLRIPAIKIVRKGTLDRDLLRLISSNSRDPTERTLDLQVQVSTNERGAAMVRDLIERMGIALVEQSIEDLLIYTRERLTARLVPLVGKRFSATSWMDDDGIAGDPVAICATVSVRSGKLLIDFAGSAPQARGAMNIPQSALRAAVYFSVKTLLDPELPPNSGFFDAVEITAPEGTIVNPKAPAAVGARSLGCNKVVRAIFTAFTDLLPPERKLAPGHDAVPAIVFSGNHKNRTGQFVYLETMGGGLGASATADGMDSIQVHMTNTSNLPVEALEHEYPLVVEEYAMVPDSGGAGRHRGGLGLARQIRAAVDGVVFSARSDNHIIAPPGMEGGQPGRPAHLIWNYGRADTQVLSSKVAALPLHAGDTIRLETAGGGGFGPVEERPAALLADDLRSGKLSRTDAERLYGAAAVKRALHADMGTGRVRK